MKKRFILLPIMLTCGFVPQIVSCSHAHINLTKIKSNYFDILIDMTPTDDYETMSVNQIVETLEPVRRKGLLDKEYDSYKFRDLDYSDPDRATWPAHIHIERTLHLAVAAYKTQNQEKMDIATKLTIWWVQDDLWNPNWWFNTIGVPRDLSNIGMILMNQLPYSAQQRLLEIVHRGSYKYCPSTQTYTGANLFWYGDITLKCALLEKDPDAIDLMIKCVSKGIVEDEEEGFQHDGTFFQHGRQIYNGGYGRQASTLLTQIIASFAGSGYTWPQSKLNILTNYILNGVRTTTHKGNISYLTMGRALCRKNALNVNGLKTDLGNIFIYKYLTDLENCPHKDEINDMLDALTTKERANFEGIKCFPYSSMISMSVGDGVFMSFKGITNNLIGSEKANNENIIGHNFSFGANTCVMSTGDEYADIAPNWDYSHLPGTTTIDEEDNKLLTYTDFDYKTPSESDGPYFCGEDGGVAFCMQKAYHGYRDGTETTGQPPKNRINYTITCFGTNNGMVILGSDIGFTGDTSTKLTTTIEQCIKTGDVKLTEDGAIQHGNVVYRNITNNGKLEAETTTETKSWHRNKESYKEGDTQTNEILKIKIVDVDDPTQYAYSIQPQSKSSFVFDVAHNSPQIQAVKINPTQLAVACYEPGSFTYNDETYSISTTGYSVIDI